MESSLGWAVQKCAAFLLMIVVYVTDKNYLDYVNTSARTLLRYNDAKIIIVSSEPIETEFENIVIPIDNKFKHRVKERITDAAYLKLYLPQLPYDKVLYLDGDTMVCQPLDELWELEPKYIALTESHDFGKIQAQDLGVKKYGLTGMMLMNLKNLREFNFTEKCLKAELDLCLEAKSIDLYGFDWVSPTYYNPEGYITKHDYNKEKELIKQMRDINIH